MEKQMEKERQIIDCDAPPFAPECWEAKDHKKGGLLEWDPDKIRLFQWAGGCPNGLEDLKEFADKPLLNANVLDWLLAHPELIPESWKGKAVFFVGTVYNHSQDPQHLCVRFLYWNGVAWRYHLYWLSYGFSESCFFAMSAAT